MAPYNDLMDRLGNLILAHLNAAGVNSMASAEGTVFKSTETSVTVKDWPATLKFIQEHELWDLLEARVGKVAALTVLQEMQAEAVKRQQAGDEIDSASLTIPGVQVRQETVLRVRSK